MKGKQRFCGEEKRIMHPIKGGGAAQTSTGVIVTRERQSVRHEQSRAEQTEHVRTGPYRPLQKQKPKSHEEWVASLLSDPDILNKTLRNMDAALATYQGPDPFAQKRSLAKHAGRAINWVLSVPDGGNVKENRRKAVRLHPNPPNKLRKAPSQRPPGVHYPADVDTGYSALDAHKTALTASEKKEYIQRLCTEAEEIRWELEQAQQNAKAVLNSHPGVREHSKLSLADADRDLAAAKQERSRLEGELQAKRNGHRNTPPHTPPIPVLGAPNTRIGKASETGRREPLLPLPASTAEREIADLSAHLEQNKRQILRLEVTCAKHVQNTAPAMIGQLDRALIPLREATTKARQESAEALQGLQDEQIASVNQAIANLPGFKFKFDHTIAAAGTHVPLPTEQATAKAAEARTAEALRAQLRAVLLPLASQPIKLEAHSMPAALVADIFISTLAEVADGKLENLSSDERMAAALDKADDVIRSLPGGLLFSDRLVDDGNELKATLKNKTKRPAVRVEGIARDALRALEKAEEALATAGTPAAAGREAAIRARKTLLNEAVEAALEIQDKGHWNDCSEAQRAAYNAVRNGMPADTDENLHYANDELKKFLTEWVDRAGDDRRWRDQGPLLHKTPFDKTSLELANQTSTLGYDTTDRPMKRLDDTLRRVMKNLNACVSQIPPNSLSQDDAIHLAAVLVTMEKTKTGAYKNFRPGHVPLATTDVTAIVGMLHKEPLLTRFIPTPAATPNTALRQAVRTFVDTNRNVVDPNALAPFINRIKDHIPDAVKEEKTPVANTPVLATPAENTPVEYAVQDIEDGENETEQIPNAAKEGLLKDMDIASKLLSTRETKSISSRADLYAALTPMIQQLELRGKLKIASGGNVGASSKLLTFPIKIAKLIHGGDWVMPVRGELKGNYNRNAVFEIGFSTTGFEIFIGSETRKGKGGSLGPSFRAGLEDFLSTGAGVDKSIATDNSEIEGVWLRLPRNGDDDKTRDEALAVLQTLFCVDKTTDTPAAKDTRLDATLQHDDGTSGMPKLVGELLANHPNLSINVVNKYTEDNIRNEISPNAALLNLSAGNKEGGVRFGVVSGGLKSERRDKAYQQNDKTGSMQTTRSNRLSGGIAYGQAGLVSINENAQVAEQASESISAGGLLNYAKQWKEKGIDTKLRYIVRDGETNAVDTRVDYENLDFGNFLKRINQNRRAWLETGVDELFKPDPKNPDKPVPPKQEQYRIAEQWLQDILDDVQRLSKGNARHVYSLSYCLQKSAAATIDGLHAKAVLAERAAEEIARSIDPTRNAQEILRLAHGGHQEAGGVKVKGINQRLDAGKIAQIAEHFAQATRYGREIDDMLQNTSSWKPWKITTSERTSEKQQLGLNAGAVVQETTTAEGQRGTRSYPK
jgi:hypothetical protein